MSKFSVKKPLTVFVAVIAVLVLGIVAFTKMTPDLLPNMDFPYVLVVTTYPGASPEKVEQEITKPMEQSMATLEQIKTISSTSSENYSMVIMEFQDGADLDTIGVDIQQNITSLSAGWEETVSAPFVLKINPSLLPVMVASVSKEGMDTAALTQYLDETLLTKLEGISGVASVSTTGMVHQQLHVVLDQKMIDRVNEKIADAINGKMDDALSDLNKTKKQLKDAQKQMDAGKQELNAGKQELIQQTTTAGEELEKQLQQLKDAKTQVEEGLSALQPAYEGYKTLTEQTAILELQLQQLKALQSAGDQLAQAQTQMDAQIAAIQNSGKPQAEIDAMLAALEASESYKTLQAGKAAYAAQLENAGLTEATIPAQIAALENAIAQLKAQTQELEQTLAAQGIDPAKLGDTVKELEENNQKLAEGISQVEAGKKTLSQKQLEGLLELANASAELSVNKATVTSTLAQVENGIATLKDTRKTTLKQADLNNILTMDTLKGILTAQNFSMPAGTLEQDGVSYMVSVGELITDQKTVEDLLLFDMGIEGVEPVYLKDVAAVMLTDNRAETYAKLDGLDSVMLTFEKQSTYATAATTNNILDRFEALEAEDDGLKFVPLMNQGDYIYLIVDTITESLLWGAVFAILILFLFLKDLRPTFITLCAIPISVIFAIVLMYFSNVTINMISLSGLAVAVGMLVDNSVVVIENIYRLRSKGATTIQAAVNGAAQVAGAVISSTLTTVCVFLPIVFVEGLTKQLFTDLALTMTYSLMASLIVALTLVPAMASGMLKKEKQTKSPLMGRFLALYEKAAKWSLDHKVIVLSASAVLLVASTLLSLSKGFIFMPEMDMPNVSVTVTMPEDATMEESVAMADEVLERIATIDGIATTGATMGSSGIMGSLGGGNSKNVTIYVILSDDTASGAKVGKRIESLCADMACEVSASSAMMDMSMLTGSGVSVKIYAEDMQALQDGARKAAAVLQTVAGVAEVSDGLEDTAPALHVSIDRNKAMSKGLTVAQIYMELASALQSTTTAATLQLNGVDTEVVLEKPEESKLTVNSLKDYEFTVTTQTGEEKTFRLRDVATVEETTSLMSISRADQRRLLTVSATLEENANTTLVTARAEAAMKKADLGDGVTFVFDGENEAIMDAMEQLALMLLIGVLLVYLIMVAQFQSLKSPFIVMFTIPLAFTGGFVALLICGMELSVISLIGFIMLTGIIVNNGIVLVEYINQLRQEGVERRQAIVEAGVTRMRPILMTSATTILGLIVMALSQDVGNAMMRPVAVVCIGGLAYATLMTLFVVPCIYDMMNKKDLRQISDEDLKELDI